MKVLVTEPLASEGMDILRKQIELDIKLGLGPEELIATIGEYEALMVRSETRVTRDVIEAGKKLQVIARAGVGVDNIDLDAATRKGIVVVNAPAANTVSAAEHAIALMFALARHLPQAHAHLKAGQWLRQNFVGIELRDKTVGIVGLGNVGSEVARRAQGLQMRIIAHDPFVSPEYANNLGAELVSLEDLLRQSDFITLHVPLSTQATGLIGAKELSLVKPTVRIVNCARGGLINEQALAEAVNEGRVAGAAVDVFSQEPPPADNPLLNNERIIVTPHLGASTEEAQAGVSVDAAEQVIAVLNGRPARYAVNAPLIPPETLSFLGPFFNVASTVGRAVAQLAEGQASSIDIVYDGEIANYDITTLKAAVIGGLLEGISEERINIVNANVIAQRRGLRIAEHKTPTCENYASLLTVSVTTSAGATTVAATVLRNEVHIVRVDDYWIDLVPKGGYLMFSDHRDRPGLIGAVGTLTGNAGINISSMQVGRLQARGRALMVLELDEPLGEEQIQQILSIPDVYMVKVVKL